MRFAYADPPYLGKARKHYGSDSREVNHPLLLAHLQEFDGWALSLSSPSLAIILPLVPEARVGAWVKPFCAWKPTYRVQYAWEPVLFRELRPQGAGRRQGHDRIYPVDAQRSVRDWVTANMTTQRGTHGAKPEAFCRWLFDLAGLTPDDEFVDLFPGSGAVSRAWEAWRSQLRMSA